MMRKKKNKKTFTQALIRFRVTLPPLMRATVLSRERNNNNSCARRFYLRPRHEDWTGCAGTRFTCAGPAGRDESPRTKIGSRSARTWLTYPSYPPSLLCDNFVRRLIHITSLRCAVHRRAPRSGLHCSPPRSPRQRREDRILTIRVATPPGDLIRSAEKEKRFYSTDRTRSVLKFSNNASRSFISTFRSRLLVLTVPRAVVSWIQPRQTEIGH